MNFKLLTPDRQVFSGEVNLVGSRTDNGSFSLLPRHIPAVMELEPAALKIESDEGQRKFVVQGGFLFKERDDTVRVLTREAKEFGELDPAELRQEIEELENELEKIDKGEDRGLYEQTRSELERSRLSLRLIENE